MSTPLALHYGVRSPVLRLISQSLTNHIADNPSAALALCDALWLDQYFECKWLAAAILGKISLKESALLLDRVKKWLAEKPEEQLVDAILEKGCLGLRVRHSEDLVRIIGEWLGAEDIFFRRCGLKGLQSLASNPAFDNLPLCFRLLDDVIRGAFPNLRQELIDVLAVLAYRSPQETAYFLKQAKENAPGQETAMLVRRLLSEFPEEIAQQLKQMYR